MVHPTGPGHSQAKGTRQDQERSPTPEIEVSLDTEQKENQAGRSHQPLPEPGKKSGHTCLLYTSPSPRDLSTSRMPSSA